MGQASLLAVAAIVGLAAVAPARAPTTPAAPSRPPAADCVWEKFSDAALPLDAWVQRCDFGFRKIDFVAAGHALAIRYSDGGAPDPVVEVLALLPKETPEQGIRRLFAAGTDPQLAARCQLAPFRDGGAPPAGSQRYVFVPDAAYQKQLDAQASPDDVPEPTCGDWGVAPDGIQYFEARPDSGVAKVLFVRVGQDEPLFDAASLRPK